VEGPLADYRGQVVPLSSLPSGARRYELGVRVYDPELYDHARYFNVEVRARRGRILVTHKPRGKVTRRYLSVLPEAVVYATGQHYLDELMSVLYAVGESGTYWSGLRRPAILRQSSEALDRALFRKAKPRPVYGPMELMVKEVRVRAKYADLRTGRASWYRYRFTDLSYAQLLAMLGELEGKPHRLTYIEFTVVLSDPTGQAVRLLGAGYLYIYHSDRKDPDGAVRIEYRPFRHVTKYVTPGELALMFYALSSYLALAIDLNLRPARHATPATQVLQEPSFGRKAY
jgi:hypothetical protein